MSKTLKDVFDDQFQDVKFDKALCQRIIQFSQQFMTRNQDHSEFFGGNLLGVNPIRFLNSDREAWYEDVLQIDESLLTHEFRQVKSVNHDFNVMGDVFNYTPVYVAHRLQGATRVPQNLRRQAMIHAFMVLHFRFVTSLIVRRFRRYPADPAIARATYNALSLRFDLRKYGSWRALLEARSAELIEPRSIYHNAIKTFKPDDKVIRVVTDTQGRIREVVKKLYAVYLEQKEAGNRINTQSATMMTTDGEKILRDKVGGYATYIRYAQQVAQSERSLIRGELVDVISSAMHTMPPALLEESLRYLSRNYNQRGQGYLAELVKETLLYVFDFLQSNRALLGRGQPLDVIIARLRALLMASRSTDPQVMHLRTLSEQLVRNSVKTRNNATVASVRTGVLLYIALRTLCRDHYT